MLMQSVIERMTPAERLKLLASDCRVLEAHAAIMGMEFISDETRENSAQAFGNVLAHLAEFWQFIQAETEPAVTTMGRNSCNGSGEVQQ